MSDSGKLLRTMVALASLLALGIVLALSQEDRTAADVGLRELVAAVGETRPVEPRLTGGFSFAPWRASASQGATRSATAEPSRLRVLALRMERQAEAEPTPDSLAAAGLSRLLLGDTERAVAILKKAAARPGASRPALLSDLSAAYLVQGAQTGRPEDFVEALAAADAAVRLDPSLLEAAFNLALALEKLHLRHEAAQAWERYLSLEARSTWAAEASQRLAALEPRSPETIWEAMRRRLMDRSEAVDDRALREIVLRWPQAVRELVEGELLGAWADARDQGLVAEAGSRLLLARRIGRMLRQVSGDSLIADAVSAIEDASSSQLDVRRLEHLIAGHRAYRDATRLYGDLEIERAATTFGDAQKRLGNGGSPLAAWAAYYAAVCAYWRGDLDQAMEGFDDLRADPRHRNYPSLLGYAEWMRGLIHINQGRLSRSLASYLEALTFVDTARQEQGEPPLRLLLAQSFALMGDHREAWAQLGRALASSHRLVKRRWAMTILQEAADSAQRMDRPRAALFFQSEAVHIALSEGNEGVIAEARLSRALIHHKLGDEAATSHDLGAVRALMESAADPLLRGRVEQQLLATEGRILRTSNPVAAVSMLGEALERFEQSGAAILLVGLHLEKGRAHLALGQDSLAERELLAGIEGFERHRGEVVGERLRISYFDQAREVFDEMIRLQVARGRSDRALEFAERSRGRQLLDAVGRDRARTLDVAAMQRRMSEGLALIHYTALEDCLLYWLVTRDIVRSVERPIPAREIQRLVDTLVEGIRRGAPETILRNPAARLYDELIRPLSPFIPPSADLVLVPDGALHRLPFAALFDRVADRYLVEERALAVTPSASLLLREFRGDATMRPGATALVVGDPAFDSGVFRHLARLPGAQVEARSISQLYPGSDLLLEAAATKAHFLAGAGRHSIVHLGSHAVANEEYPLLSHLVLAPEPGGDDSGALLAYEIYEASFPETRLVVLAACSTARARISPGEGVLSLARPFLAAGVPSVVASLWDVDDRATATFFDLFYRHLRAGDPPLEALRSAQLDLLRRPDPSRNTTSLWAAFEVVQGAR